MDRLVEREPAPRARPLAAAPALAVQFFLIPLMVVAAVVLVYAGFRLLLADERTPQEYLNEIRAGGRRSWPAAYELSRLMVDPTVQAQHPTLGPALVRAFAESKATDPRVRRYLALAIGRLHAPPADSVSHLVAALEDPDSETRISVIWALGSLGDVSVLPELERMYASDDAGIRKMVVYALGALPGDSQLTTLRTALNDPVPDVQWNAAIALARHGDPYCEPMLRRMLDRDYVERMVTRTPSREADIDPVGEVMVSGLQAVAALREGRLREAVTELSRTDRSLRVRQVALETLAQLATPASAAVDQ